MSDMLKIVLVVCATIIICLTISALTVIAMTHDGNTESEIIIALIGFASTILTGASSIGGHWQGALSAQQLLKDNKAVTITTEKQP